MSTGGEGRSRKDPSLLMIQLFPLARDEVGGEGGALNKTITFDMLKTLVFSKHFFPEIEEIRIQNLISGIFVLNYFLGSVLVF